ncbi:DEAD/DEAH box helicase [Glaciecola sp. 1036]|uniref:DEAD/DEAH box helicase n=1 Tax=Alteromonadaceae TaxID=72275 RepID=UPI003D000241
MLFTNLGLSPEILRALEQKGYTSPTPIQAQGITPILEGKDVLAAAQTGTGKTAGFILPIIEKLLKGKKTRGNSTRALVLTPTRELAAQVQENAAYYAKYTNIRSDVVFGGVKINPQMQRLRGGVDILIATPGRLLDLHQQNAIKFDQIDTFVLDEADRMLDMGFIRDIRKIIALLPAKRQNLMFSATFSADIKTLAKDIVQNPIEISVSPENATAHTVEQWIVPIDKANKPVALIHLLKENKWRQVLVFSRTKHGANRLAERLSKANIPAAAIHGNKSQGARTKALAAFKDGTVRVLVATDIAARGIDIKELPHVINFDLPNVPEDYVHRIGRTGRAGSSGQAISLVSVDEFDELCDIEQVIQQLLERREMPGFEPRFPIPVVDLKAPRKPKKPKKPKKQKPTTQPKQISQANSQSKKSNEKPKTSQSPNAKKRRNPRRNRATNHKTTGSNN